MWDVMVTDIYLVQVATLKWLHENTNIPVPRIFTYDDDPRNIVGAAYMIQERVSLKSVLPYGHRVIQTMDLDFRKATF